MSTDANKLECIQQRFAALSFNCFFPQVNYNYSLVLWPSKLHTLPTRRHHLDEFFLTQVYLDLRFCPLLETVGCMVVIGPQDLTFFNKLQISHKFYPFFA
jgi:hypothetical protein